jgi:hypothetical protein
MKLIDADALNLVLGKACDENHSGHLSRYDIADALYDAPEFRCAMCRFWDMRSSETMSYPHRCTVSGSFSCRGGELWTDPEFGCCHFSRRQP